MKKFKFIGSSYVDDKGNNMSPQVTMSADSITEVMEGITENNMWIYDDTQAFQVVRVEEVK